MTVHAIPARQPGVGASPRGRRPGYLRSPKGSLTLIFLPLLLIAGTAVGWPAVLPHVLAAVAGACLMEWTVQGVRRGWVWPGSAFLSGLIVAFILGPETPWVVTLIVGAAATVSKYLLKTRRGHIFNPAALALLVSIPLFATGQSWWGALSDLPWPLLLALLAGGAWIADRLNKFPLVLSFAAIYFGLFTLVGLADPARVAEMYRPPFINAALFFACFMLTDPPTSPGRYSQQIWVGGLIAIASCAAQLLGAGQAYLLLGLLVGNAALGLRRWARDATRQSEASVEARPESKLLTSRRGESAGSTGLAGRAGSDDRAEKRVAVGAAAPERT